MIRRVMFEIRTFVGKILMKTLCKLNNGPEFSFRIMNYNLIYTNLGKVEEFICFYCNGNTESDWCEVELFNFTR